MNFEQMGHELDESGWLKLDAVYAPDALDEVKAEYKEILPIFQRIQHEQGVGEESRNATHHSIVLCPAMLGLIDPNPLHDFLEYYFEGRYILNTMGASVVQPGDDPVYTQNIHRDLRSFSRGYRLQINTLIMLDDSTEDNGATWMLEGSHRRDGMPSEEEFYAQATRATGRKGDVLLFDANLWHAAGLNTTGDPRMIITPIFSRPFVKQGLDYPRAFGLDFAHRISPQLRQILGYNARTPQSLEEFYKPRSRRFYAVDQG